MRPISRRRFVELPLVASIAALAVSSKLMVRPSLAQAEDQIEYGTGAYVVGRDIPAGEYVFYSVATIPANLYVYGGLDSDDVLLVARFFGQWAIELEEGRWISLRRGRLVASDSFDSELLDERGGGMWRIGKDLPAGVYQVVSSDTELSAKNPRATSYNSACPPLKAIDEVEPGGDIDLTDASFVEVKGCAIRFKGRRRENSRVS